MSYSTVFLVVLGSGVLAGALAWLARRTFRLETLRRHHEIGGAVFLQLGVIYAVLLAFVFSEVWGEYNTAADAINQENGNLHGAAILAASLPSEPRDAVEGALQDYLATVIEREWPAMARGAGSEAASAAFQTLWLKVARLPAGETDATVRGQILARLGNAHQWRETRLFQMELGVPPLMWVLLIGLAVVLVGFLLCFGIEVIGSQIVFTAVFAASLAFVLALVRTLDYPFEGALRLPPTDFQETLRKVTALRDS